MLRFLLFLLCARLVYAQDQLPSNNCEPYFAYQTLHQEWIGVVTLPPLQTTRIEVKILLSQRGVMKSNYTGTLTPYPDIESSLSGEPVKFHVHFADPQTIPKVTRLTVNENILCSDRNYAPPSAWYELIYTLNTYSNAPPNALPTQPQRPYEPAQNPTSACGQEGSYARPFIYGGTDLVRGQFPWMSVIFQRSLSLKLTYICGGSLVSARTIITAAHCFPSLTAAQVLVQLGRYNLEDASEQGIISRDVLKLIKHPDYKSPPDADVAILHIQAIESFSDFIRPICLWRETADLTRIVGQSATVAGWGSNGQHQRVSPQPKRVEVNVVSELECLRSSAVFAQVVSHRTLCAGNRDGNGPCMGDSGSGLVLYRNDRWVLRGIVSFGQTKRGLCNLYEYVIYADLAQYTSWMFNNVI